MASRDDCLRYAAECVSLAQHAPDSADRAHLLAMAQAWRDLADKQNPADKQQDAPAADGGDKT
jgi:hypothetical protein